MALSIQRKVREASQEILDDEEEQASEQLAETQAVAPADTSDDEEPFSLDEFGTEEDTTGEGGEQEQEEQEAFSLDEFESPGGDGQPQEQTEETQQDSGITPSILDQVQQAETGGEENPDQAVGDIGEIGRFQFRPSTAMDPGFGVEGLDVESEEEAEEALKDPQTSRDLAKDYLEGLEEEFDSTREALIAWQWGPGETREWIEEGKDPSDLPEIVRERVDRIAPTSEKAAQNLEEGGFSIDPEDLRASAALPSGSPEQKVKAAEEQSDEFNWADEGLEAWERGVGFALRGASEGLEFLERGTDYIEEVLTSAEEASSRPEGVSQADLLESGGEDQESTFDQLTPFDDAAEFVQSYARTFDTAPSELPEPDSAWDYLNPRQINRVLGESLPMTLGIGATFLANPYVGAATAAAVEGGFYLEEIDRADQAGAELSEGEKLGGALLVGSLNAALEKTGIDRILGAARAPGVKNKILQTLMSSGAEGITEAAQETNAIIAQNVQTDNRPLEFTERDGERLARAMYSGAAVGFTLGGAGAGINAIQERNRPDATFVGTEFDEDGNPQPQFRVIREGFEGEGRVTREDLEQQGLRVPEHRAAMLQDVWQGDLEDAGLEPERANAVIQANMVLLDQKAQKKGVSLEQYLEENKVTPVRGGMITEEALNQFAGTKADWGKTERRALERAKELDRQGFDEETIRQTTGWFRNPNDEMWRMEVPAEDMDFSDITEMEPARDQPPGTISDVVDTDHEIFELYPELRNVRVKIGAGRGGSFEGVPDGSDSVGMLRIGQKGQWKKTFWHELQHAIQYIEGFARGANPNDISLLRDRNSEAGPLLDRMDELKEEQFDIRDPNTETEAGASRFFQISEELTRIREQLTDMFDRESVSDATQEAYQNVAGEIEARVAASRNKMRQQGREPGVRAEDTFGSARMLESGPESPVEAIDQEADEDQPIITRFYDNPVRSKIEAEGKSPLLQDHEGERATQGAFQQTRDGRTLIQLMENADESTIPHEISHLFRRTLTDTEDQAIRDELGIAEWSRENEEQFARQFERWLFEDGEAPNAEMEGVFEQYDEWLANVYGQIQGSEIDVETSQGVRNFFDRLFEQRVQTEEGRNWIQRNVVDFFDVESRFSRVGQERTGREIKRRESFKEMKNQEGLMLVQEVSRLLGGDQEKMTDAILAAESDQRLQATEDQAVQDAAEKIRAFFEEAKTEYQKYGRLPMGFHERLAQEIRRRREDILEEENPSEEQLDTLDQLSEQLEKAEDLNFVHIPVDAWFRTLTEKKPEKLRKFLNLAIENERETVSINDLLEDPESPITRDDLNLQDIITSYSRQLGNDLSLLRIREAAKQEGAAVEGSHDRLVSAPDEAIPFQGMSVNAPLNSWLNSMVRDKQRSRFKEWINLSKMFAFWNPLFLPTYDVLQGAMLGSFDPLSPVSTTKNVKNAVQDVVNQTDDFWEASEQGIASQPFSSPIDETRKEMVRAYEKGKAQASLGGALGALVGRLKGDIQFIRDGTNTQSIAQQQADTAAEEYGRRTLLSGPFQDESNPLSKAANILTRAGGSLYEMSWDTSWFLDRLIRQVTYRHLRDDKGLSPEEAAQTAATAHGDYASVPQETRDTLNTVFFTPTFKIAMGKFLGSALRGSGEVITNNEVNTSRRYAATLARTTGIMVAFDAIMTSSLGFDRDEFGRAYCRPTSATRAPREVCISWSTPFNLFSKYSARVWEAFNEPDQFNPINNFLSSNRWELNPMWRVGLEIASNSSAQGGSIYNELDPLDVKMLKMTGYYGKETIRLTKQLMGEEMGQRGREALAEDLGNFQSMVLGAFTFPYIRQNEAQRMKGEIQRLMNVMEQEVGLKRIRQMLLRGAEEEEIQNFIDGREQRHEEFNKRLEQILERYQQRNMEGLTERPPRQQQDTSRFSLEDFNVPAGGQQ